MITLYYFSFFGTRESHMPAKPNVIWSLYVTYHMQQHISHPRRGVKLRKRGGKMHISFLSCYSIPRRPGGTKLALTPWKAGIIDYFRASSPKQLLNVLTTTSKLIPSTLTRWHTIYFVWYYYTKFSQ